MNYAKKQFVFFLVFLITGALLVAAALLWAPAGQRVGIVSGVTGGFGVTGAAGLVLSYRLIKNPEKAEETALMKTEERAQYLRMKTQSSVYSITIMLVSAGTMAAMIAGYRVLSLAFSGLLLIQAVLYCCFGSYYAKRY